MSSGVGSGERDPGYGQRQYVQQQAPYGIYTSQHSHQPNSGSDYVQTPLSASTGMHSEFSFRHPGPETSSAQSPFLSPRAQVHNYAPSAQQMAYPQQARYGSQSYVQPQFSDGQPSSMPRLAQPVPVNRHSNPVDQLQTNTALPYTGVSMADQRGSLSSTSGRHSSAVRDDYFHYSHQLQSPDETMRASQPIQHRYSNPGSQPSNLLPPLHCTVPSAQSVLSTSPAYNTYVPPDSRLASQPVTQPSPHDSQSRYVGYPTASIDLEERRALHEPG